MQTLDLPTAPATPHQQKPRNSTTKDISRPGKISGLLLELGPLKNIRPNVGPRTYQRKNIRPFVGPTYLQGGVVPDVGALGAPWMSARNLLELFKHGIGLHGIGILVMV